MTDKDVSPFDSQELPEDLQALDEVVGEALRASARHGADPAFMDRVIAASAEDLPGRTLAFTPVAPRPWASPQLRAAAALLLVTGLALVAWFASTSNERSPAEPPQRIVLDFRDEIGMASAEEVMLVAILDGDGAWIELESLNRPAAIEAEPVLRTRGTNVDDLAEEINQILGATS